MDNDDDDDDENEEEEMEVERDNEVDFPKLGAKNLPMAQNIPLVIPKGPKGPVAVKNINLIRAPKGGK